MATTRQTTKQSMIVPFVRWAVRQQCDAGHQAGPVANDRNSFFVLFLEIKIVKFQIYSCIHMNRYIENYCTSDHERSNLSNFNTFLIMAPYVNTAAWLRLGPAAVTYIGTATAVDANERSAVAKFVTRGFWNNWRKRNVCGTTPFLM